MHAAKMENLPIDVLDGEKSYYIFVNLLVIMHLLELIVVIL
jgi:hypothetical protein